MSMAETKTIALPPETHSKVKQANREMAYRDAEDYTLSETVDMLVDSWRDDDNGN